MRASIERIQEELQRLELDGWLLYVWRDVNPVAITLLGLEGGFRSRRCYYWIPARGEPRKLQHAIEPHSLESLPGPSQSYLSYQSLARSIAELLRGAKRIAMEYSPEGLIPTVSWVDGGTLERVRSTGVEVVSSADLIQIFEATLTDAQIESHFEVAAKLRDIAHGAFEEIGRRLRAGEPAREAAIQRWILDQFEAEGYVHESVPIVAANANASDPHYNPAAGPDSEIKPGDSLLIDLWAKKSGPTDVYGDETWMGSIGEPRNPKLLEIWELVRDARRAGFDFIKLRADAGEAVYGWEVDDVVRRPIEDAGYGDYFFHRTGHSITTLDHGSGANIDNLETKELRPLIPRTLFSIEPGIYLPDFGVRSEYDVLMDAEGRPVFCEGTDQQDLIRVEL